MGEGGSSHNTTSMMAVPWLMFCREAVERVSRLYSTFPAVGSAKAMHDRNSSEHIACTQHSQHNVCTEAASALPAPKAASRLPAQTFFSSKTDCSVP